MARRLARRLRPFLVGLGSGYALALVVYAASRPRTTASTGILELVNTFAPWWYLAAPLVVLLGLGARSRLTVVAGLAAVAAFVVTWGDVLLPARTAAAGDGAPTITVMTLNVLASNAQHGYLAATIAAESPDVVALQELEPDEADDLVRQLGEAYPHRAFRPVQKLGAGVLSRFPLRDVENFQLSDSGNWAQRVVVDASIGPISLLNVHPGVPRLVQSGRLGPLPVPGYDTSKRNAEVRRVVETIDGVRGPLVVAGDFNMSEYSGDYHAMRARLGDAYRAAGRGFGFTFPRPRSFPRELPAPWPVVRLDYVWHSPELRPLHAHVGSSGGSDHRPVIVRFVGADAGG